MVMKKALICLCVAMLLFLSGCKKDNATLKVDSEPTIGNPPIIKLYPIADDNFSMMVNHKSDSADFVTEADVNTIINYVDRYTALCNNNAALDYDDSELEFLRGFTMQDVFDFNKEQKASTILIGCQILSLDFYSATGAQVLVLSIIEGDADGKRGRFIQISSDMFEKINDEWFLVACYPEYLGLEDECIIEQNLTDGTVLITII